MYNNDMDKKSTYNETRKRALYNHKKKLDRIEITAPKGTKDIIKSHASSQGESVNQFVNRAINEQMKRDNDSGTL